MDIAFTYSRIIDEDILKKKKKKKSLSHINSDVHNNDRQIHTSLKKFAICKVNT